MVNAGIILLYVVEETQISFRDLIVAYRAAWNFGTTSLALEENHSHRIVLIQGDSAVKHQSRTLRLLTSCKFSHGLGQGVNKTKI